MAENAEASSVLANGEAKKPAVTAPDRAQYEAKLAELKTQLEECDSTIESLQTEIDQSEDKTSNVSVQKDELLKTLRGCLAQKRELHSSTSQMRMKMAGLDRERMEIRSRMQNTR